MAPSLLSLCARLFAQIQISRPRSVDPKRTLRFWYLIILLFNIGSLWSHAISGVPEGRTVILDFIGMAVQPSKTQLVFLDLWILFLSFVLTTISFETSYINSAPAGSIDTLAPSPSHNNTYEPIPSSHTAHITDTLVLELTLAHFKRHIRNPPPPHDDDESESSLLPLPATSAALPRALRAVMQARAARARRQTPQQGQGAQAAAPGQPSTAAPARAQGDDAGSRRVPGAIDDPD